MWYRLASGQLLNLSLVESLPDSDIIADSPDDTVKLKAITGTILITKADAWDLRQALISSNQVFV